MLPIEYPLYRQWILVKAKQGITHESELCFSCGMETTEVFECVSCINFVCYECSYLHGLCSCGSQWCNLPARLRSLSELKRRTAEYENMLGEWQIYQTHVLCLCEERVPMPSDHSCIELSRASYCVECEQLYLERSHLQRCPTKLYRENLKLKEELKVMRTTVQ